MIPLAPWAAPEPEDIVVPRAGRPRTVRQIQRDGDLLARVAVEAEGGPLKTYTAVTWTDWCRRHAARYLRGGEDLLARAGSPS